MFSKLNLKFIVILGGVLLLVAAIFFIRQSSADEKTCKVTVGGKQNPCQCTQRLER